MLYLFFLVVEVMLFAIFEKKLWGTYITPLNALSIPTTLVIIIAIVYSHLSLTFYNFYLPAIIVWIVGFALFQLSSVIFSTARVNYKVQNQELKSRILTRYNISSEEKDKNFYKTLCYVASFLILFAILKMPSVGDMTWGSDEFAEEFVKDGIVGHVIVFICAILGYMVYEIDKKHKYALFLIFLSIVVLYGQGVKSWIFVPILSGLIARIVSGKTKLNLKVVCCVVVLSFLIFIISYLLIMVVAGQSEFNCNFIEFLFDHFMFYLIGGPLSFSIDYQNGLYEPYMFEELISPIINLFNYFSGDKYINPINPIYLYIGHSENNVRTAMGTIFAYSQDWLIFIIFNILLSLTLYIIFAIAIHSNNIFIKMANCCNIALLCLGFFDYFWLNLSSYEIVAIYIILAFLFKYLPCNNKSVKRRSNIKLII